MSENQGQQQETAGKWTVWDTVIDWAAIAVCFLFALMLFVALPVWLEGFAVWTALSPQGMPKDVPVFLRILGIGFALYCSWKVWDLIEKGLD